MGEQNIKGQMLKSSSWSRKKVHGYENDIKLFFQFSLSWWKIASRLAQAILVV
jgi:hypothetical protein